jgi:hypothetical protein
MNRHDQNQKMEVAREHLAWPSQSTSMVGEEELLAEVDEPPDHILHPTSSGFCRSMIRPKQDRQESLLTKALLSGPDAEMVRPEVHTSTEMARRRSTMSNTSMASTVDLTSDGDLTSPARTNTPSPPYPNTGYLIFAPVTPGMKIAPVAPSMVKQDSQDSDATPLATKPEPTVEALTKKRCITFACGGKKPSEQVKPIVETITTAVVTNPAPAVTEPVKRACTIKFACPTKITQSPAKPIQRTETSRRHPSRSPSLSRKARATPPPTSGHRDSTGTVRRASQSPVAVRARKPKYLTGDEKELKSSEATRFHEFASEEVLEDDWISKDVSETKTRLTIGDTLKKENAIRQLGKEAEEEALQDEEDEDNDSENDVDDLEDDEDEDEDEEDDDDDHTVADSDDEVTDGNETDNEEGFAASDDESDAGGDFEFWTPGRSLGSGEAATYRASARRSASDSSIDSLRHMSPLSQAQEVAMRRKPKKTRRIRIRPGTPDLPDSTDFVCGTLDEDRPLEEAYVSCMEARKREKRHAIPQDIDPSFPTSDPEQDDDEDEVDDGSEEDLWLHGKFEASDEEPKGRRRSAARRSPKHSPKRHHSPPPPRQRHRSPPPRRLFGGHSPRRMRSPPPTRAIKSPTASPLHSTSAAIAFAPLGQRPGLTHTKSLPRTPNAFCQQYRAARLAAVNATLGDDSETADGHTRGAIDIVKGLERKRQRRKEKFYQKHCNRARKTGHERKPQPGKGAERMRELGLQMAGKGDIARAAKAKYVLSV